MKHPIFSIIVPTYNRKVELRRCLDSILKQTIHTKEYEVIIVDDGSELPLEIKDISSELLNTFSLINIQHGGPSKARNKGAEVAQGEFLVFFEDDIIVNQDYLANASRYLSLHDVDVLEGITLGEGTQKEVRRFDSHDMLSFIPCNLIVCRNLFLNVGGYDPAFFDLNTGLYFREDADFGFRLLRVGAKILKCDELVVEHPEQFSSPKLCLRHALRYYFDPLLYRKDPIFYRKYIERKYIAGINFQRPLHKLSLGMIVSILISMTGIIFHINIVSVIGLIFILLIGTLVQNKYQRKWVNIKIFQTVIFIILPIVYLYALIKGCIYFRSFRCLV